MLDIEYTDISDDEANTEHLRLIHKEPIDVSKNKRKDLDEAENMIKQTFVRVQMIKPKVKTMDQEKALFQYRRQIAARITK